MADGAVPGFPPPSRPLQPWQAAALRALVLLGGTFALGGALTLFAIGLLGNGRGISALDFSWPMFGFSVAAGVAQAGLSLLGCRAAWQAIAERSAP